MKIRIQFRVFDQVSGRFHRGDLNPVAALRIIGNIFEIGIPYGGLHGTIFGVQPIPGKLSGFLIVGKGRVKLDLIAQSDQGA